MHFPIFKERERERENLPPHNTAHQLGVVVHGQGDAVHYAEQGGGALGEVLRLCHRRRAEAGLFRRGDCLEVGVGQHICLLDLGKSLIFQASGARDGEANDWTPHG